MATAFESPTSSPAGAPFHDDPFLSFANDSSPSAADIHVSGGGGDDFPASPDPYAFRHDSSAVHPFGLEFRSGWRRSRAHCRWPGTPRWSSSWSPSASCSARASPIPSSLAQWHYLSIPPLDDETQAAASGWCVCPTDISCISRPLKRHRLLYIPGLLGSWLLFLNLLWFYRGVKVKQGPSSCYQLWLRLLMKIVPPALI